MLPGDGVDIPTMERTLMKVHREWKLHETWGWDFPMLAMCAARLGKPEMAVDYLLDYPAFDFDACGLVGGGRAPFPYFPGNGGLLYAVDDGCRLGRCAVGQCPRISLERMGGQTRGVAQGPLTDG